jgi:hypothetical protein
VSRYPAPAPIHDFVLLFLPPCGSHLTLLATGSLEPNLLVSPLLGGPARVRPFAPALYLYQHKSSHILHLQYSAKSQSTPCCQSLITPRSDHPPVLRRSGPQTSYSMGFLSSRSSMAGDYARGTHFPSSYSSWTLNPSNVNYKSRQKGGFYQNSTDVRPDFELSCMQMMQSSSLNLHLWTLTTLSAYS